MSHRTHHVHQITALACAGLTIVGTLTACNDGNSTSSSASDENRGSVIDDLFGQNGSDKGDDSSAPGPEVLDSMTTGNALYYEGQGRGPLAGARFTTPDESVFCQVSGTAAVCVPTSHPEWPSDEQADIGPVPDGRSDSIGWFDNLGVPYAEAPRHWQRDPQGFPAVGTGAVLDDRVKLDILTRDQNQTQLTVTCGSADNIMTCTSGDHGFTVGTDDYRTW